MGSSRANNRRPEENFKPWNTGGESHKSLYGAVLLPRPLVIKNRTTEMEVTEGAAL